MLKRIYSKIKNTPLEVKASTSYTLCSILQKSLSFITLPLFTRLLTTAQYGQYTVYTSWASLLTIIVTLNLAYGTFQTAMMKFKDQREAYTSSACSLFLILGILFLLIYLPVYEYWNRLFGLPTYIMIFMTVELIANGATDCWLAKQRFEYKYKSVIAVTLGKAVSSPVVSLVLVMLTEEKGYARIIGYAIINTIVGFIIMGRIFSSSKVFFEREYWKFALAFNIPLIPYYISQMIFNTSDRIMISYYCGSDQAAIYGVAYSLSMVLNFVINAINSSYAPWFFECLESRKGGKNRKVSTNLAVVVAFGLFGVISVAPEFITIMAGMHYESGIWAVPPVVGSMLLLFYTQLFDRVLFYYEKKYWLIFGGILPSAINLLLNYIYIPKYGFVAAAYTTLVSYCFFAVINYFTSRRTLSERYGSIGIYDVKKLILLFVIFSIASVVMMGLYNRPLLRYSVIMVMFAFTFFERNKIIKMIRIGG